MPRLAPLLAALLAAALPFASQAQKQTVCTVTINSADEREAFRAHLPAYRFEIVELAERGRTDWMRSACARGIRCDVLVVSGHFAGTEFYSSKADVNETLRVDEIERAQCSESCPGLFGDLKEVYLFGCDSLKPEAVRDHGEASRDVMQRLFAGTPLIYGFSSLAPYGRVAGPMLQRHLQAAGADEVGSGRPSAALLRLFGPSSMVATAGLPRADPASRGLACRFLDERVPPDAKVEAIAEMLAGGRESALRSLERVEGFLAASAASRGPAFEEALRRVAADTDRRERFLATAREIADPMLRLRFIAVARALRWLSPAEERAENARLVAGLLQSGSLAHGDVDLICRLNDDAALNAALSGEPPPAAAAAQLGARACLGDDAARGRMLRALASGEEGDVQVAQAYFRHRPISDAAELREAARRIAAMAQGRAQVRALETLARFHVDDEATLAELARLFARAPSLAVQRAIAEIFMRARSAPAALAGVLRRHRLAGDDLVDAAIRRLESS